MSGKALRRTASIAAVVVIGMTTTVGAAPTLTWLACKQPVQIDGFKKLFVEFEKQEKIKVVVTPTDWDSYSTKLLLNVAAGRKTDFYAWGTDFVTYANAKTLVPVDSYLKTTKVDFSKESKPAMKAFQWRGQQWGIPYGFYPVVLYYNKGLFDQAGIPHPSADWADKSWNWSAFLDAAKKLTKMGPNGKPTQTGLVNMQNNYFWPWYFGGDWSNEDGTQSRANDPKTIRSIQEVVDLFNKYKVAGWDGFGFDNGKSAMAVDGVWAMSSFSKISRFKWDIAATPWGTDHSVPAFVDGFSVGNSKNKNDMWKFIEWMYRDKERVSRWLDYDSSGSAVPTDRALLAKYIEHGKEQNPGINLQVCVDALDYATPMYFRYNTKWPKISQAIEDGMARVMTGKRSVDEGMQSIHREVERVLKTAK